VPEIVFEEQSRAERREEAIKWAWVAARNASSQHVPEARAAWAATAEAWVAIARELRGADR
jgi:hypothetical protein